jgi:hypothetical protein
MPTVRRSCTRSGVGYPAPIAAHLNGLAARTHACRAARAHQPRACSCSAASSTSASALTSSTGSTTKSAWLRPPARALGIGEGGSDGRRPAEAGSGRGPGSGLPPGTYAERRDAAHQLRQLLGILLRNALVHMPAGTQIRSGLRASRGRCGSRCATTARACRPTTRAPCSSASGAPRPGASAVTPGWDSASRS